MILGRVIGEAFGTLKHPFYEKKRILILEKLNFDGKSMGDQMMAIDSVDAGVGDTVLVLDEGTGARQIILDAKAPLRSIIVGVVDQVEGDYGADL